MSTESVTPSYHLILCRPALTLCVCEINSRARRDPMDESPGKSTGVGSHFLLRGILPTQGSNPGLLRCRQILY